MTGIFDGGDSEREIMLLGYRCHDDAVAAQVIEYLNGLSHADHSLFCEWVPYGLEGAIFSAEDMIVDQQNRVREGIGDATRQTVLDQISQRVDWLDFIDRSDRLAWLTPFDPEDGIGEGDTNNLEWEMIDGGSTDPSVHAMVDYAKVSLGGWERYLRGETRMRQVADGPGGVVERMYRMGEQNTPEAIARSNQEFADNLMTVFDMLAPMVGSTVDMLDKMGITPEEAGFGDAAALMKAFRVEKQR